MPILSLKLETVSPLFLYGADQRQPELRAASVRGQLRYWARAILGARSADLATLREREAALFGSTERGSVFTIRTRETAEHPIIERTKEFDMMPHKGKRSPKLKAIDEITYFWLDVITRQTIPFDNPVWIELRQVLSTWLLLGGLGRRSRRMFGGLKLINYEPLDKGIAPAWWNKPTLTYADLVNSIKSQLA